MPDDSATVRRSVVVLLFLLAFLAGNHWLGESADERHLQRRAEDKEDAAACSQLCGESRMMSWDREHGCQCLPEAASVEVSHE